MHSLPQAGDGDGCATSDKGGYTPVCETGVRPRWRRCSFACDDAGWQTWHWQLGMATECFFKSLFSSPGTGCHVAMRGRNGREGAGRDFTARSYNLIDLYSIFYMLFSFSMFDIFDFAIFAAKFKGFLR